jgi:two-component system cell cycle response regulator
MPTVPMRRLPSHVQMKSLAPSVPWFAPELEPLLAIATATLDEDGNLIEANAGFLRLINVDGSPPIGARIARFFIQPDFTTLVRQHGGADGEIHAGLLTIGDRSGRIRTLRARIWRVDRHLRVLAEHDIEEMERLSDTVLELNRDYAQAQFSLVQINLKLQQREAQIVASSLTDPLTGVGNRRRLDQALAAEIGRCERTGGTLSAFIADLDHFKQVNDTYGHEAGDAVLAAFGGLLRQRTRATDIVARFGGEEFVGLMPNTDLAVAVAIAERIREAFAAFHVEPLPDPVTVSFGVAEMAAGEEGPALLRRADNALYQAKRSGRNRVAGG